MTTMPRELRMVRIGPGDCPSPHSQANKVARVLWALAWLLLFRPTPKVLYRWRAMLLRLFGARVGLATKVFPSVRIWAPWNLSLGDHATVAGDVDCYCVAPIRIGAHATVSQYAMLCTATHDVDDPRMRLVTAPVVVDDEAWVCAGAYVGPGTTIGRGAVAGARAVVIRDVPPWMIVAGNPARAIRRRMPHVEGDETS